MDTIFGHKLSFATEGKTVTSGAGVGEGSGGGGGCLGCVGSGAQIAELGNKLEESETSLRSARARITELESALRRDPAAWNRLEMENRLHHLAREEAAQRRYAEEQEAAARSAERTTENYRIRLAAAERLAKTNKDKS